MRIQGLVIFIILPYVKSKTLEEGSGYVENFESGIIEGPVDAAIVDGEDADIGEHPWHVGLVREESQTGFLGWFRHLGGLLRTTTYCGASLVGRRWLITAAHCIRDGDRPVDLRVVMGSSKRARFFYYFFQTDSIDQIHIHPKYDNASHAYDIAILRLKKLPDLEPGELWPVCLPQEQVESYAGDKATVIGWGKTSGKQSFSSARILQELGVTVISQAECQRQWSYGRGRVDVGGPKMCFKSEGASCHGDSGGGMFLKKEVQRSLIGVCSYGLADCQNWAPEVYTKVSFVLDWIKEVFDGDKFNVENCGVTTARGGSGKRSWKEIGQKFFEGRQVWR
eukprot:GFUD01045503.1.p1 GENE.GFUD01045503.1~~GFUD01045503.1.p1  ORF type:complete len:337 (+),score=95.16 GFUD01045503.1:113-1123(+)